LYYLPMKSTSMYSYLVILGIFLSTIGVFAGGSSQVVPENKPFAIGIFVPGVVEGSPTYEMMVGGVRKAVEEATASGRPVDYQIFEAGFNQAEWPSSMTSLAASGAYDLIVTSNPSMPEIVQAVVGQFPNQHFLVLDGYLADNPRVKTIYFNQYEQAFLAGYLGGLITNPTSGLSGANSSKRLGLLAGQEYPVMNDQIRPGFSAGASAVDADIEVDFRVLGNWYDGGKAADLVRSMIGSGADVVLTIAGGGNQGAISAAAEAGTYVIWYDASGYTYGPGTVIGSTLVLQEQFAYRATLQGIQGTLDYGVPEILGISDGAVGFDFESPEYRTFLPPGVRDSFELFFEELSTGQKKFESPNLF